MEERWLPIPGYAGFYEASDLGEVFSMARTAAHGGLLSPQLTTSGYRQVTLCRYGRVTKILVGRVVLLTFCGRPSRPGMRARHGPGGPLDDSLANLWWG